MKLTKTTSGLGKPYEQISDIRLTDESQGEKSLNILYGGNSDLYWLLKTNKKENTTYETFSISKEDYEVYKLFDDLYYDIINTQVFKPVIPEILEEELSEEELEEERIKETEDCQRANQYLQKNSSNELLVQDGAITWYSDEFNIEEAEIFRITKHEDEYLIEFIRQNTDNHGYWRYPGSINVRISNSGSRYEPFNVVFMRHFQELQTFERNPYHQIHMEEYMYQKKMK